MRKHRLLPFCGSSHPRHVCGGCLKSMPERGWFKKRAPSVTCDNCGSVTHDVWMRGDAGGDS